MPGLQIPMKTASTGGAAADYETTIDSAYDLYTTQLKNYPVANALEFETGKYTQEFWGLQITSRAAQNTAFQSSLSLGAASGTGNLTLYSRTASFTKDIKQIVSGNLKYGIFLQSAVDFDSIQKKAYIATAGGNKFAITAKGVNIKVAKVASDGNFLEGYTETEIDTSNLGDNCYNGEVYVLAAKGDKVWLWYQAGVYGGTNVIHYAKMRGSLYTVGSDGSLTLVGHTSTYSGTAGTSKTSYKQRVYMCDSYVHNDTAHVYAQCLSAGYVTDRSSRLVKCMDVDLTTTTSFSFTDRYTQATRSLTLFEGGTSYSGSGSVTTVFPINLAYDSGSDVLYYIFNNADQIWSQTTTGSPANTGNTAHVDYSEVFILRTYDYLNNGTGIYTNATDIVNQAGNLSGLPSQTQKSNIVNLFEITGSTHNENDTYLGTGIANHGLVDIELSADTDIISGISMVLKINGVTFETTNITPLNGLSSLKDAAFSQETINGKYIQFDLVTTQTAGIDHKIAYSVTGGTYATPTFNYEVSTLNVLL